MAGLIPDDSVRFAWGRVGRWALTPTLAWASLFKAAWSRQVGGMVPTLAFSDPQVDPHGAGRRRTLLDGKTSIGPLPSSGWTPVDP